MGLGCGVVVIRVWYFTSDGVRNRTVKLFFFRIGICGKGILKEVGGALNRTRLDFAWVIRFSGKNYARVKRKIIYRNFGKYNKCAGDSIVRGAAQYI